MALIPITEFADKLGLELLESGGRDTVDIDTTEVTRPGLQLAGFFACFPANRVQVLGNVERAYLDTMTEDEQRVAFDRLFEYDIPCVAASCKFNVSPLLLERARLHKRIVFKSRTQVTSKLEHALINYLSDVLAPWVSMHGVFMDVYGVGVLITGVSGIGKSETALELVKRGHRLVADDAVIIRRVNENRLVGEAPGTLRHLMEIRGIGIINVEHLYGAGAVIQHKSVDMVINLETWDENKSYDRLGDENNVCDILGVQVPKLIMPVRPGRNLAIIIEVAARNIRLKDMGIDAFETLKRSINLK